MKGSERTLEIRKVEKQELAEAVEIYLEGLKQSYGNILPAPDLAELEPEWEYNQWLSWLGDSKEFHYMAAAFETGKMVGFVAVSAPSGMSCEFDSEVEEIFVRQEVQNRGIGSKLLKHAFSILPQNGCTSVVVQNIHSSRANGFYRKMGGKVIRQITSKVEDRRLEVDVFGWDLNHLPWE